MAVQIVYLAFLVFGPADIPGLARWAGSAALVSVGLGLMVGMFGAILGLWGLGGLGRNLTILPRPKDDSRLVTDGPYRIVRHPIYCGVILGSLGWALLWASPFRALLAIGLFLFFDIKSRREETWLRHRYPGYAAYARQTRKLIPFIY